MFQCLISSNLLNFLSRCRLKYMSISLLIVNIRSIQFYKYQPHSSPRFSAASAVFIDHINHFSHLHQKKNKVSKWNSDRPEIIAKAFLKLPNLLMLIKKSITPRNLALTTWQFANSVFNKDKTAICPLFSCITLRCCLLHLRNVCWNFFYEL